MAFHPDFPATPRVYVTYTSKNRPVGEPDTHLSEFTSNDGGLTLDPASERIVFTIQKEGEHHHGGRIGFSRDGLLYMSTGDGFSVPTDNGQSLTTLRGKMLRIDIRGTTGTALYKIPPDNPFAASTTLCNQNGNGPQNCSRSTPGAFAIPGGGILTAKPVTSGLATSGKATSRKWTSSSVAAITAGAAWRVLSISPRSGVTGTACAGKKDLLPPVAQSSLTIQVT